MAPQLKKEGHIPAPAKWTKQWLWLFFPFLVSAITIYDEHFLPAFTGYLLVCLCFIPVELLIGGILFRTGLYLFEKYFPPATTPWVQKLDEIGQKFAVAIREEEEKRKKNNS